ncbi:MAG: FecR family protein [Chthonomonadales bacterium]|nr:FecR family protein [Chthonomonadales bacterium]
MKSKNAFGNRKRHSLSFCPGISGQASRWALSVCGLALLGSVGLPTRAAADTSLLTSSALGLYDDPPAEPQDAAAEPQGGAAEANAGPVRLARFSSLTGDVTWRDSADGSWSPASQNMPLRQGAQIWVADGGRAEIQFDDGSRVRLDSNTLITLQTLFSDTEGEFTEITLNDGRVYLHLNNKYSLYQVNTPQASLKAIGPAQIRVGGGKGAQFGVRSGAATIEGTGGKADLNAGDYLDVEDANAAYNVGSLPRPDAWDTWNLSRDEALENAGRTGATHLPANVALVADDLDESGTWHNDSQYGWVWSPRNVESDWRPYRAGHWTWVEPFGWTWVSTERWGWAPYHYGSWVHQSYGWGWVPGPTTQYWSPGVVSFTEHAGVVAWCPLAPAEVRYPSRLALGFRRGNWSTYFSIGGAAVYYPTSSRYCEPRPFQNVYVNRVTYINHVTNITNVYNVTNITVNRNTYQTNERFIPSNARWQGGTQVQAQSFGGKAIYQPSPGGTQSIFARGQVISGPASGHPVAGPQSVRVTAQSLTATREYQAPSKLPQQFMNRTVYRAPLPANVPHAQVLPQTGQHFTSVGGNASIPPKTGGARPTGSTFGKNNDGSVVTRPPLPGRPNDGTGVPPKTGGVNSPKNTGSSGLDAYLRERNARNGNTGKTGGDTGGKPPVVGGNDTPKRTRVETPPNDPRQTHVNDGTTTKNDPTHRTGDDPKTPRFDPTKRTGDDPKTPRFDPTHRPGDSTTTPKTGSTSGDSTHTSGPPKPTGDTRPSRTDKPPVSTGNTGKTGRTDTGKTTRSDPKSTDQSKDKDNSKDKKNP